MFHLYEVGSETRLLERPTFGAWLDVIAEAWEQGVDCLTVTTSGSTGEPKHCTHTFASLQTEVSFLASLFSKRRRIVSFTPANHIYGVLFTGLLPDRLGIPVVDLERARAQPETQGANSRSLQSGDLVVTFPDGWRWIDGSMRQLPEDVEGVTSTAPCPRDLLQSLADGKLTRIVEVYGSSETAGIGTRIWPDLHYRLMPHLELVCGSGRPYELKHQSGQRVQLMDEIQWFDDGSFLVAGRKDACLQVGGNNVSPLLIEQRLQGHPGVAEATVRLMRPEEGTRLKCFIVPRAGYPISPLDQSLREFVASWPRPAERPVSLQYGQALPRNSAGKICDWPIL